MPFDIASTRTSARVPEPDELEQLVPLLLAAGGAGEPLVEPEHLVRRVPAREAEELGQVAERGARRGDPAGAPQISARPRDGRMSPQAILTSVDFPAPFGPSRPTSSPGCTSRLTPASAWTRP